MNPSSVTASAGSGLDFYMAARPEIALGLMGLILLMAGAFGREPARRLMNWGVIAAFIITGWLICCGGLAETDAFAATFTTNHFVVYIKLIVLGAAVLAMTSGVAFAELHEMERFEYPLLMLFAVLGMLLMVSANDFLTLYLGLEMQSLCLYVLAAFQRDRAKSSEAGLKYFLLGSLASGILLYGVTLLYGATGTTQFSALSQAFNSSAMNHDVAILAMVFLFSGMLFKVAAAPFHMWAPDVYQGAPTSVTTFFAAVPKAAAFAIIMRVAFGPLAEFSAAWSQIFYWTALASLLVGSFAALAQSDLKRLLAYSSIGHAGYALIGLAAATEAGVSGILIYLAIYVVMSVGAFGVVLSLSRDGKPVETISDLAGLSRSRPMLALAMAIFMFSLAGVPPLAGFFGKLAIFLAAIDARLYVLATLGVLASAVSTYYYLRIVKVMYFDEAKAPFDPSSSFALRGTLVVTGIAVAFFFIYPSFLMDSAKAAAATLFAH